MNIIKRNSWQTYFILSVLGLCSCTNDDVILYINNLSTETKNLSITGSLGGKALAPQNIAPGAEVLVLQLPDDDSGDLSLTINGRNEINGSSDAGCITQAGHTTVNYTRGNSTPTKVFIDLVTSSPPMCELALEVIGNGSIDSEPSMFPCAANSACKFLIPYKSLSQRFKASKGTGSFSHEWVPNTSQCQSAGDCVIDFNQSQNIIAAFIKGFCGTKGWCNAPQSIVKDDITSMWGTHNSDIWAVGANGLIAHFNGAAWSLDPASNQLTSTTLLGIWGDGKSKIWAVGTGGSILSYDGKVWAVDSQSKIVPDSDFNTIWGDNTGKIWAAGTNGTIIKYQDNQWAKIDLTNQLAGRQPVNFNFRALSGLNGGDIWLVGRRGIIWHFDGTTWLPDAQSELLTPNDLLATVAVAPGRAWIGGAGGFAAVGGSGAWQVRAGIPTINRVRGFLALAEDDVRAFGDQGMIQHYTAGTWTSESPGTTATLFTGWSSSPLYSWIAGSSGQYLFYQIQPN